VAKGESVSSLAKEFGSSRQTIMRVLLYTDIHLLARVEVVCGRRFHMELVS
jgi:hypothetical protein